MFLLIINILFKCTMRSDVGLYQAPKYIGGRMIIISHAKKFIKK